MRILLAEDNAIVRKAVAAGLATDGHLVEQAEDGERALAIAHTSHPDLIISDVLMPNMDGFTLCEAVRTDDKLHDIPVVFYSSTFLDPEDEVLARRVGASGFILKDEDPETFRHKLHEVIESKKQHKPPPFDIDPKRRGEAARLHRKTLIDKLHRKVVELEAEKRALKENRRFLNIIVTTIPDVIFVLQLPDLNIGYIAPQAERLLGYPGDELIGSKEKWRTLIHDADRERVEQELFHAVVEKKNAIITCRMRHRLDGMHWVEGRVSPRIDSEGVVTELVGSLTDVTERYEKEEQIRSNERRLNTLFSNLPGMAYRSECGRNWNMEFVSDGVEELTGYRRDEVENSHVVSYADLIHPDDQEMVWDGVKNAFDAGEHFSLVYRIQHKDGSLRWVWERGVGVEGTNAEPRIEGFVSDITLRMQAEEALRNSERRYRSLFEMMTSGMSVHELVYDRDGNAVDYRFLDVNPAFERLTGLKAEQVLGRTAREALPGIEEEWIRDYVKVAKTGVPAEFVRYSTPLDRYYQVVAFQIFKDQFTTVFNDISEQVRAEEKIRNLARFPEESPSPVIRISAAGEVLYANPASKALVDFCYAEGGDKCNPLIESAMRALRNNAQERMSYVMGQQHFSFVITPVNDSGYANLYGRDVTKRVIATQQLERTNHVLRTLSQGNRSMIHAASEGELLQSVCDVLSNEGNYPFVWAAYINDGRRLQTQVRCGTFSKQMQLWADELENVDLTDPAFSDLLHSSDPILFNPLRHSGWTMPQIDAAHNSELSALVLLPMRYRQGLFGVIGIFSTRSEDFDESELSLLREMANDVAYGIQAHRTQNAHEKSMQRIQSTMFQTIEAVSRTLEKRDPYTAGHQQRVMQLAVAIGKELDLPQQRIDGLRLAAQVHDIGKIHVPAEILNRPGRLTDSEYGIIKSHPQVGYEILKDVEFDWPIAEIVLQHHERCDGSGYPQGLLEDQIVPEARILAVADVVEAITSHRPYRPSLGLKRALDEIEKGRGRFFCEDVVDTCLKLFREKGFSWDESPSIFSV